MHNLNLNLVDNPPAIDDQQKRKLASKEHVVIDLTLSSSEDGSCMYLTMPALRLALTSGVQSQHHQEMAQDQT